MIKKIKKLILKKSKILRAIVWLSYNFYDEHDKEHFFEMGIKCIINPNCLISHKKNVILKNNIQIHRGCVIYGQGGLYIGNNVGIAEGTTIMTAEHVYRDSSAIPFGPDILAKPVYINDNVWIGTNVRISSGVEIGEGAIVGMGSVVVKDVPPFSIVFGNPAKVIGYRDKDGYENCKKNNMFVKHQYCEKIIVPKYTQIRSKLFKIVEPHILNREMIIDDDIEHE